jgi:hypothetical protein
MTMMLDPVRAYPMYDKTWAKLPTDHKDIHDGRFYALVYNRVTKYEEWVWVFMTQVDYPDDHGFYQY